jgi:KaiC/GvpD/RAD55 family RecA-like ATPase
MRRLKMSHSTVETDDNRSTGFSAADQGCASSNFKTDLGWFDAILPTGVPVPSTILISGPSGTGKPLVGLAFAGSWLKQGGRVIFIPIHAAHRLLFESGLRSLHGLSLEQYSQSHFFVLLDTELDPREENVEVAGNNAIRCNLVNPKVWREALAVASTSMEGDGPILVFASALNVLLMSPSYGEQLFLMLLQTIREPKERTYMLAISSSIMQKKAIILEQAADHLFLMQRVPGERQLHVRAARVRNAPFHVEPVPIPGMSDMLEELKDEAVASRRILIPTLSSV